MSALSLGQANIALASTGSTRIIDSSSRLRRVLKSFSTSLLCVCMCIFWSMHHRFHSPCTCYIADLQRISNFISAISILFCDRFRFILLLLSSLGWSSSTPVLALIYLSKLRYTALFFNRDGNLSVIHWPSFIIFSFGCLVSFLDNTCHSFFSFENLPHELLDSLRFLFPMLIDTLPAWLDTWHIFTLA